MIGGLAGKYTQSLILIISYLLSGSPLITTLFTFTDVADVLSSVEKVRDAPT